MQGTIIKEPNREPRKIIKTLIKMDIGGVEGEMCIRPGREDKMAQQSGDKTSSKCEGREQGTHKANMVRV
jgi:hypothetical protein